uniref:Uncharacterized protein n=1 Tax=Chromera velia CCMP2878 TaxID=1169474 RepID=A0A0G4GEU2_9ALVE|eukprot:Cvel_21575.t1-p1 / transcript=Cvel_21575.t1 / gene=Cvel_21575 / organism=Chromera_velia_CCMP2878 / gene_product=hypothetical protein / transcript_product=hypothetical protein / location=Cvel_scaffold2036:1648-3262(+) / protein_length=215 / sequence_SO=supercontig / SO=protein_coding / is_pseudo=false
MTSSSRVITLLLALCLACLKTSQAALSLNQTDEAFAVSSFDPSNQEKRIRVGGPRRCPPGCTYDPCSLLDLDGNCQPGCDCAPPGRRLDSQSDDTETFDSDNSEILPETETGEVFTEETDEDDEAPTRSLQLRGSTRGIPIPPPRPQPIRPQFRKCNCMCCNTINSRNECQGVARYAGYRTGYFDCNSLAADRACLRWSSRCSRQGFTHIDATHG